MTFGEKLKAARIESGLKQSELAKKLNTTGNTISNWENNVSKPDLDMLSYICGILHVTASYFLQATIPEDEVSIPELKLIKKYRSLDPLGQSHVDTLLDWEVERSAQARGATEKIEQLQEQLTLRFVPPRFFAYYGKIAAAGTSVEFSGMAAGTKSYPENEINKNADYVIGVNGDSMEPEYSDGDIVYVRKTEHISMGAVGIFQKGNSIYIKKVGEKGLISLNSDYPPLTNDGDAIIVLGEVLGKAEEN